MNWRKPKPVAPSRRTPNIIRQKQSTFQYSSNRSQAERSSRQQSQELDHTNKQKNSKRFFSFKKLLILTLLIAAIIFLSSITKSPKVLIENGISPLRSMSVYTDAAAKAGSDLSGHSKFTINRSRIVGEMKAQFPEIQSVDVKTPLFAKQATVKLVMETPSVLLNVNSGNFVLDSNGTALYDISKNKVGVDTDKLLVITDQSNPPIEIGKPALTSSQINFVKEVMRQSDAKKLSVESVVLVAGGGELDVKYNDTPYIVKFNFYEDARKSFGTFISTKEQLNKSNIKPTQYVDVRVPERAYVK